MTKANHTLESQRSISAKYWKDDTGATVLRIDEFCPATDRNQSGELLGKCAEKGNEVSRSVLFSFARWRQCRYRGAETLLRIATLSSDDLSRDAVGCDVTGSDVSSFAPAFSKGKRAEKN